jgi:hypothetical protein
MHFAIKKVAHVGLTAVHSWLTNGLLSYNSDRLMQCEKLVLGVCK